MNKVIKIIITITLIALFMAGLFYFNSGVFLEHIANKSIEYMAKDMVAEGIKISDYGFDRVGIKIMPPSIIIRDFNARFEMTQKNVFQIENSFFITVKIMFICAEDIKAGRFTLNLKDAVVTMQSARGGERDSGRNGDRRERMEINNFKIPFHLDLKDRREIVRKSQMEAKLLFREFGRLAKEGTITIPIEFSGSSVFTVDGEKLTGKLLLSRSDKEYCLVMDPNDFTAIALKLNKKLTREEFMIYSKNPMRLPRLLRIRDYAYDAGVQMKKDDPDFPDDAYKHILWSYLLCNAYGEKFAKEITDGHETPMADSDEAAYQKYLTGIRLGKNIGDIFLSLSISKADHEMDLLNNFIGREYARLGYSESSLVGRMFKDGRVIRSPTDIRVAGYLAKQ